MNSLITEAERQVRDGQQERAVALVREALQNASGREAELEICGSAFHFFAGVGLNFDCIGILRREVEACEEPHQKAVTLAECAEWLAAEEDDAREAAEMVHKALGIARSLDERAVLDVLPSVCVVLAAAGQDEALEWFLVEWVVLAWVIGEEEERAEAYAVISVLAYSSGDFLPAQAFAVQAATALALAGERGEELAGLLHIAGAAGGKRGIESEAQIGSSLLKISAEIYAESFGCGSREHGEAVLAALRYWREAGLWDTVSAEISEAILSSGRDFDANVVAALNLEVGLEKAHEGDLERAVGSLRSALIAVQRGANEMVGEQEIAAHLTGILEELGESDEAAGLREEFGLQDQSEEEREEHLSVLSLYFNKLGFADQHLAGCSACQGKLRKVSSGVSNLFKGKPSGWGESNDAG